MVLTRKHLTAVATIFASLTVLGIHSAQAATGTIKVGEDTTTCSQGLVTVDYDLAYSQAVSGYAVTSAHVTGLDPSCASTLTVTLNGPRGAPLVELSSPVTGAAVTVPVPHTTPVRAEAVTGVSVVLTG